MSAPNDPAPALRRLARDLSRRVGALSFGDPVTHVYDPTDYARRPHALYLGRARRGAEALLVGMNPGPWGMAQTGVPFGDPVLVREWMGIEAPVGRPELEHPKKPVRGFASTRREGSGRRLWGWAAERFGTPERFFERFFVWNYCPLCFLEAGGRNRTPDALPAAEREPLFAACDRALRRVVEILEPRWVIAVGGFAEQRAAACLEGLPPRRGRILHPSPANPAANRGWAEAATRQLEELDVAVP